MPQIPIALFPGINTVTRTAHDPYTVFFPALAFGGLIKNPLSAGDQGLLVAEPLFVTIDGSLPSTTIAPGAGDGSTIVLQPGKALFVPAGNTQAVMAASATAGHKFSALAYQTPPSFTPATGPFPPDEPTTLQKNIPSYLYVEYNDDDTLQAFITTWNNLFQKIVDWFNETPLPIYTNPNISGPLLDWVGQGLYGYPRPSLPSGFNANIGPYNTFIFDQLDYNEMKIIGSQNVFQTTDDIYKRCLTWHLYKGDGKYFNVRWLKRRVYRWLYGINGTDVDCSNTYPVSVTFGGGYVVNIGIGLGTREIIGGALYDRFNYNEKRYNEIETFFTPFPNPIPISPIFKAAVDSGVLALPFQDTFNVIVSST